jgi:hypothetical protein
LPLPVALAACERRWCAHLSNGVTQSTRFP